MRGIVLAGGTGSRLGSLTRAVNKHMLPVGGQPMVYWPIKVLRDNGVHNITVVSTARGVGQLAELLGGAFEYRVQDRPGGVAQAIACAETKWYEPVAVVLGDNIFSPSPSLRHEISRVTIADSARCYLAQVPRERLSEFGVPLLKGDGDQQIIEYVHEKPSQPSSEYAVTGLYLFSPDVFDRIRDVRRSDRGEIEVTDLLNSYARKGKLMHSVVDGFWGDAGTLDGLAECSSAISRMEGR